MITKAKVGFVQSADIIPTKDRTVNGYIAENSEKWNRAVFGSIGAEGALSGGSGEKASGEQKLANYDKLGGLVTKGGRKIKTGSFFDFATQSPKEKPEVIFVFRDLEGNIVEVPEGEEVPLEVRAAEIASANKAGKNSKADSPKIGASKKAKHNIEDEE